MLIRSQDEDSRAKFAFHRGPHWRLEHASVYQAPKAEDGVGKALRIRQNDSEGRFVQFEHLLETDGNFGFDEREAVLLDTVTGTLFREV